VGDFLNLQPPLLRHKHSWAKKAMTTHADLADRLSRDIEAAKALLRSAESGASAKEEDVYALMSRLQEFAAVDPARACSLMTALWPLADELFMHDVCDSIDLWIAHNPSPVLLEYLRSLSANEPDADLKRHWDGLISIL
jgi:hypothetical protein